MSRASCLTCRRASWTLVLLGWCPWCQPYLTETDTDTNGVHRHGQ